MASEFKLPDLGENIETADVVKVLVSAGDSISVDDPVLEVETDKAVLEVPSSVEGTIAEVKVNEGDTIEVGRVVLTLEGGGGEEEAEEKSEGKKKKSKKSSKKKAKKEEEEPAEEAEQAEAEEAEGEEERSPKVEHAGGAGTPWDEAPEEGDEDEEAEEEAPAEEGEETEEEPPEEEEEEAEAAEEAPAPPVPDTGRRPVFASPSVRQFAREIGVNIGEVKGTGPGGRISEEDVKKHARSAPATGAGRPAPPPDLPDLSQWGEVEPEKISKVRKLTAEHLSRGWQAPHVTLFNKADVTDVEELRQQYKARVEKAGGKLTITAIMMKVVVAALKAHPMINAALDLKNSRVIKRKYFHIGIAADTPRGLVVPVIRDVDKKNIIDLSVELTETAEKARKGKLTPDEMQGGTFTITNLGGIGTSYFTPIINSPEVAILGVGRAENEPVWIDGEFQPRLMMPLSLSFDHRLVDGADGARFLTWIVNAISQPLLLALEG